MQRCWFYPWNNEYQPASITAIPEDWAAYKFFKILLTVVTSTLCKTKSSHSFQIFLEYSPVVLIPDLFFGHEDPKNIWMRWYIPSVLLTSAFFIGNQRILLYQEIQIYAFWYITSNSFDFFESLKIFFINTVAILMMSVKLATQVLLKIKIFQNKDYDVIVRRHS